MDTAAVLVFFLVGGLVWGGLLFLIFLTFKEK